MHLTRHAAANNGEWPGWWSLTFVPLSEAVEVVYPGMDPETSHLQWDELEANGSLLTNEVFQDYECAWAARFERHCWPQAASYMACMWHTFGRYIMYQNMF